MKPSILYNGVSHFFLILFIYSALGKLTDLNSLKQEMATLPLLGSASGYISWTLPIVEILLVVILFIPAWRLKGLYASLILMIIFTIYILGMAITTEYLSCSCGGIISELSARQHLIFNTACILLAWIGIRAAKRTNFNAPVRFGWISPTLAFLLLVSIGWIVFTAATSRPLTRTGLEGKELPSFDLLLADSTTHLDTRNIQNGKPFIIIGFSPYCPHCRGEIQDIIQNLARFKDTRIFLITSWPITDLKYFYLQYHLEKYPTIIAGVDNKNAFLSYFKKHIIPYTAIYDTKKRLAQTFQGRADIDQLSKCLSN